MLVKRSVLALVDDQPWDMNRPLENGCKVKFLHFKDPKPYQSNLVKVEFMENKNLLENFNFNLLGLLEIVFISAWELSRISFQK